MQANCCALENDDCCASGNEQRANSISDEKESIKGSEGSIRSCGTTGSACTSHLKEAFDKYSSYLEKGRCICRSVLGRLDVCCGRPAPKGRALSALPDLGVSSAIATPRLAPRRRIPQKTCKDSCCDQTTPTGASSGPDISTCGLSDLQITSAPPPNTPAAKSKEIDVENSAAREHVFLSVSGMTCTGCIRKLVNVLSNIDGISSINATFVTGVADFDLDSTVSELQEVMSRVEKETGFKLTHIVHNFQTLDVRVDRISIKSAFEELQDVVESAEVIGDGTYRITYDPKIIGARTILASLPGSGLAPPKGDRSLAEGKRRLLRMAWSTFLATVFTIPVVVLAWSDNPVPYKTRSIVSLVLASFVQTLAIPEFYVGAIKSLVYSRVLEMDMLVVISITAAYGYSVVAFSMTHAGYTLETGEFFETSSLLITLVLLGRLVAAIAKVRAVSMVSLRSLQAEKALLVQSTGDTIEIDARLLQFGDVFVVPAHGRVVTDGEVINGHGSIDESMITGESLPVPKAVGDYVVAGTINGSNPLTVRITRLPGKNSITDIANLVENALAVKPRIQDLADKVASYFIPAVIAISLVVFGIWMAVATRVRGESGGGAVGIAITYGIAVLAVSCPCALGLAVPMVLVIAGGVAARHGVIIKQSDALERGYKVTDVVFDKTGTITKGDLSVTHEQVFPHPKASGSEVCSLAKSITKDIQHPVSIVVAAHLQTKGAATVDLENVESIPGAGLKCTWNGLEIKAGNPYWLGVENSPEIATALSQGMSLFCITFGSELVAVFGLRSSIRDEAHQVIADLQRRNIECHIVSGDSIRVVEDVANTVGIPLSNIAAQHSPAQKQLYVERLMSAGKIVLFCGDGTNDAVAVAQANVGVQIGSTSDLTRGVADVILLGGLDGLPTLLDLSKRTFHRIGFNFLWSAVYNLFAILLAAGAFVKARIPPAYAGLGEIVSVLPVIIAALTLLRHKGRK
ncbi:hypothetical protein ABW19_dt0206160 [Dactylella cylindrospora]|nr:hypothetical protein ABW19_dt0206160 [Dactylella cylindrospora]